MTSAKPLSVRAKMLLALVASMIVLCIALLFASTTVIQSGFEKVEQDAMQKDLSRLSDQLQNAVHQELVSLNDWSTWDESYQFGLKPTKAFADTNLRDSGLANLDIEVAAYFDPAGKIIFAKEIGHDTGTEVPHDATLAVLSADSLIPHRTNEQDTLGGFIAVPNGILQFGSRPLLQSSGEGPMSGSLLFARYLDAGRIKELAGVLHLSVDAFPYDATDVPADIAGAKARIAAGQETFVAPVSASSIAGYTVLRDIHGAPLLLFRITESRPIFAQGNISIATFYALGGAALLVFGIFVLFLLDRLVIARFVSLTRTVQKINDTKDLSVRVPTGEMDEIGSLGGYVNQMLGWLSEAKEAEAKARREILNLLDELKTNKQQEEEIQRITKEGK